MSKIKQNFKKLILLKFSKIHFAQTLLYLLKVLQEWCGSHEYKILF